MTFNSLHGSKKTSAITSMTPMFAKLLNLDINFNKFELWSEKGWEQII